MPQILEVQTKVETKAAEKNVKDLEEGIEGAGEATNQLTASLDKMTGGAITAFRGVVKGAKSGVVAMRTLQGAIAATGVGLLVVAVGTLVSYFKNTQRGSDLLNQAFATIGATIDVLIDRVSSFGEGLFKIISGDFSEGLDILKGSMSGIVDEIKNESAAALQLEQDFQALERRRIDFIVTETKLRAEIEASNLAADDFTKSVEERAAANENAIKVEKQLAEERIAQTTEELRILTEKNKLGESLNEDVEAQKVLEARLFQIETDRDKKLKSMVAKQKSITAELTKQGEGIRPETDILEPLETMEAAPLLSPEGEVRLSQEEHLLSLLKTQNERFQKEKVEIDIAAAKFRADQEELIQKQKYESIMAMTQLGFNIASTLAKKGSKEAKAIAVGQVLFDTYRGIQSAFAQTTDVTPTQTLRFINAGAAAVFGFANVKKILSTPTAGGGGGFAPPSVGGGARPSVETPRIPNFNAMNQGVGGREGFGSVRAVVIQQDIKDSASLDNRVDDLVKIGK